MPGGASKLRDVRKLADAHSTVDLEIPLAELPGLPVELIVRGQPVRAQLRFGREQGFMVAHVQVQASLELRCQRCMGPMTFDVRTDSAVMLLQSEAEAERTPPDWETVLAADGRIDLGSLVAEELLLALPLVPRHTADAVCEPPVPATDAAIGQAAEATSAAAEPTTRPFAELRALLERGEKPKR